MLIYKITNKINNKIYVGQTKLSLSDKLKLHINKSKYGKYYINNAIRKYGIENFTIEEIEKCKSKEQLNEREIYWIKELNSKNKKIGYNLTDGGDGNSNPSLETRKKMSISHKGQVAWNKNKTYEELYGKTKAKKLKLKQKSRLNGKTYEELYGVAIAIKLKQNKRKTYEELYGKDTAEIMKKNKIKQTTGKNNGFYGKKHSLNSKLKMRGELSGKWKNIPNILYRNCPNCNQILQYKTKYNKINADNKNSVCCICAKKKEKKND